MVAFNKARTLPEIAEVRGIWAKGGLGKGNSKVFKVGRMDII